MIGGVTGEGRRLTFRTFRRIRIGTLLGVLVATVAWAAGTTWRRHARTYWERPLQVAIVLLTPDGRVDAEAWRAGSARLASRLAEEMRRWRGPGEEPFAISVVGPVRWTESVPLSPASGSAGDRLGHAVEVWRTVRDIDAASGGATGGFDVRVYFLGSSRHGEALWYAEGTGARNGEVAFVRGSAGGDLSLPLQAIGHELLHTVGASDKYDADGHARVPEGLADPERVPRFPQDHAEWMVGEVAVAPGTGRVPATLEELQVGPATAREIGWVR
jgi:hypothetical protein